MTVCGGLSPGIAVCLSVVSWLMPVSLVLCHVSGHVGRLMKFNKVET